MDKIGGIDAGGTSWRCAIFQGRDKILARVAFPTTTPEETLAKAIDFFNEQASLGNKVATIGVACFGPLGVNKAAPNWGYILATPKAGWSNTDVAGTLVRGTGCRVEIDTDVTAAAFAERAWGVGRDFDDLAYVTVGTGIGVGIIVNGRPIWGAMHPEAGHIRVPRHPDDPLTFEGVCTFHGDCVEGLASARAIKARWSMDAADIPDIHPCWEIEAHYLAHLAVNLVLVTAVRRIIFGGGVCARPALVGKVAAKAKELLGPYGIAAQGGAGFDVVPAGLGLDAGLLGGLWLASQPL